MRAVSGLDKTASTDRKANRAMLESDFPADDRAGFDRYEVRPVARNWIERNDMKKLAVWIFLMLATPLVSAAPVEVDLHERWDQRCQVCHGHSGPFARKFLRVENGRLVGAHHESDLDLFLRNHYLTDKLVEPMRAMLTAQVTTPPLFAQKCAACHGTAATFVRKSLAVSNGSLVGVSSGRKVADYLSSHGGLLPDEVSIVVDSLTRVRSEVGDSEK